MKCVQHFVQCARGYLLDNTQISLRPFLTVYNKACLMDSFLSGLN